MSRGCSKNRGASGIKLPMKHRYPHHATLITLPVRHIYALVHRFCEQHPLPKRRDRPPQYPRVRVRWRWKHAHKSSALPYFRLYVDHAIMFLDCALHQHQSDVAGDQNGLLWMLGSVRNWFLRGVSSLLNARKRAFETAACAAKTRNSHRIRSEHPPNPLTNPVFLWYIVHSSYTRAIPSRK